MGIQKILPIARKMGEENFLAYKQFSRSVKSGNSEALTLNLKGINIIDTINITAKKDLDITGLKNFFREVFKMYFPKAGAQDAIKKVQIAHNKIGDTASKTEINTTTQLNDENVGKSAISIFKDGRRIIANINTICEEARLSLATYIKLKKGENNMRQSFDIKLNPHSDLKYFQEGDKTRFVLSSFTNPDAIFKIETELPNSMIESLFGGEFEKAFPSLIEKSGFKPPKEELFIATKYPKV